MAYVDDDEDYEIVKNVRDVMMMTSEMFLKHEFYKAALNGILASGYTVDSVGQVQAVVRRAWDVAEESMRMHKFVEGDARDA